MMNPLVNVPDISSEEIKAMTSTLQEWSAINTHCSNFQGLEMMLGKLEEAFSPLGGISQRIKLSDRLDIGSKGEKKYHAVGEALCIKKNPEAPFQILLAGHIDTVFEETNSFQKTVLMDANRLSGPGVADMKGGIIVMLKALELFERSTFAKNIGWQVLLTPDEEIGSPSSELLYRQVAKEIHVGLIFEPSFPDGKFVSQRKGSLNLIVVAKGKTAHAGRDFHKGRNAIAALAYFISSAHELNRLYPTMNLNVGKISGGEALNIVPELANCHINIRADNNEDLEMILEKLIELAKAAVLSVSNEGIAIEVHTLSKRASKPFDSITEALFQIVINCGKDLGMNLDWKATGGVCDGNILAQAGVPTIDTLGVVGGNLHTHQEYMEIQSLAERARLTASLLMSLASQPEMQKQFRDNKEARDESL
jgi:glutamate carboxypeptidase